jgi:CRP-like cAMP-binding protein
VRTIEDLLGESATLAGLDPEHRATIAGCATLTVCSPGDVLMREGSPADTFYVLREGAVALETVIPGRGRVTIETLHGGEVLGWSWIIPPYRTAFDARALERTRAIAFDGACLRGRCETDPGLGFALLKVMAGVLSQRLTHTRMRLLDLYAGTPA